MDDDKSPFECKLELELEDMALSMKSSQDALALFPIISYVWNQIQNCWVSLVPAWVTLCG